MEPKIDRLARQREARALDIKTIRPAMFGGYDLVIYECRQCREEVVGPMK
jgi:hypothetical protein